jgi:hypothetical protein
MRVSQGWIPKQLSFRDSFGTLMVIPLAFGGYLRPRLLNAAIALIANHMHLVTLAALEILPPPLPRALSKSG